MKNTVFVLVTLLLGASGAAFARMSTIIETPEPGTIGLLGTGLAAMGLMAWRRRKQK